MVNMLAVAGYFNKLFRDEMGKDMDQMRMHKMMYLVQRESLMYCGEPLFQADFKGWRYGPVLLEVRKEYLSGNMFHSVAEPLTDEAKELVKSVYDRYKGYSSWKLSSLSHAELSWKNSRAGLSPEETGTKTLKLADMRVDAAKERLRRERAALVMT